MPVSERLAVDLHQTAELFPHVRAWFRHLEILSPIFRTISSASSLPPILQLAPPPVTFSLGWRL